MSTGEPMTPDAFDVYAGDYARLLDDPLRDRFASDSTFFIARKCEVLLRNLEKRRSWSQRRRVLDAGCGQGVAVDLLRNRCSVVGSDVSFAMLATAAQKGRVVQQEPFDLPFATGAFDAAFAFCVYHHIDPHDRLRHLRELGRVVRPGGSVFVFEHNPLNPVTRVVFNRAPVDRGCRMIPRRRLAGLFREAGLRDLQHGYLLFVPESLQKVFGAFERRLEWLPFGGQYYVAGRVGEMRDRESIAGHSSNA